MEPRPKLRAEDMASAHREPTAAVRGGSPAAGATGRAPGQQIRRAAAKPPPPPRSCMRAF